MDENFAYEAYKNAEIGVLGSILVDAELCLKEILLEVNVDDFVTTDAKVVWRAIVDLNAEGLSVDVYTVSSCAPDTYQKLIKELVDYTPTAYNWETYVKELKRLSKLDKANKIAKQIVNDTLLGASDILEIRQQAEELLSLLEDTDAKKTDYTSREMVQGFLNRMDDKKNYLDWGMQTLNKHVMCEPGDYVLLGAEPSVGKTALTVQFAVDMARKGNRVVYFSYETTQSKIADRIISCQAHVSFDHIKRGTMNNDEKCACVEATKWLWKTPLHIIEAAGMTIEDIRSKVVKYAADVIFIDYVQLIANRNPKLSEYERTTENSMGIRKLCQKHKVIAVALSQFSRLDGRKPGLHSFRSSGQLEHDADFAVVMYRPDELVSGQEDHDRIFEIVKLKEGRRGQLPMYFDGEYQTFSMIYEQEEQT